MKQMEKHIIINYHWKRDDGEDIPDGHAEMLEEAAWDRISKMINEGYVMGDLQAYLLPTNGQGEEISYSGWWGTKT